MKSDTLFLIRTMSIALVLVCAVICAGCITVNPSQPGSSSVSINQSAPPTSKTPTTTTTLSHGVTIRYPSDWQKEVTNETSVRDYGRNTTNIANFYSPYISGGRVLPSNQNVDTAKHTTMNIDVDPNPVTDFEKYCNTATRALKNTYSPLKITKQNNQSKISSTPGFGGYTSYQLDFDTDNMRWTYIFTNVGGTVYIFSFQNPSPYAAEVQDMYKSISIVPKVSSTTQK